MTLHNDKSTFEAAVLSASERLQILPAFIEKDYWLTLVLKRLSESKFNDDVVFKGGTSLSKGYKLIDRFSEDIDIAIIEVDELPGNQLKNLIREVEKTISQDMIEIPNHIGTSKGSRFRKSYFMYPKIINDRLYQSVSDKLIIEINSFANPFPFEKMEISSLIFSSLLQSEKHELISKYGLTPFSVNVLSKSQTMLEKLVSLYRFSFEQDVVKAMSGKIRHFYDLHFLLNDRDCKLFVDSETFKTKFEEIWQHDQSAFDEPIGWNTKSYKDSILMEEFSHVWSALKSTYNRELSSLAFSPIPNETVIFDSLDFIFKRIAFKV